MDMEPKTQLKTTCHVTLWSPRLCPPALLFKNNDNSNNDVGKPSLKNSAKFGYCAANAECRKS